jgi:hypothetical protein
MTSRLNKIDPDETNSVSTSEAAETASEKGISMIIDSIAPGDGAQAKR